MTCDCDEATATTKGLFKNHETRGFARRLHPLFYGQLLSRINDARQRSQTLQKLFSTFPSGPPGLGLLLLRAAVGIVLIAQGASGLVNGTNSTLSTWIPTLMALGSGVSLLSGFMTPVGSLVAALLSAGIALSWLPRDALSVLQSKPAAALVAVMAAALACLGPGAFSIDSRLFGRREIVIPPASRSAK